MCSTNEPSYAVYGGARLLPSYFRNKIQQQRNKELLILKDNGRVASKILEACFTKCTLRVVSMLLLSLLQVVLVGNPACTVPRLFLSSTERQNDQNMP